VAGDSLDSLPSSLPKGRLPQPPPARQREFGRGRHHSEFPGNASSITYHYHYH